MLKLEITQSQTTIKNICHNTKENKKSQISTKNRKLIRVFEQKFSKNDTKCIEKEERGVINER